MPGVLVIGRRQRAGVELAVDRQRKRIHRHHRGRNHISRQPLGQCGSQLRGLRRPGYIPNESLIAGAVLAGDHHRLLHTVEGGQCSLNLSGFDAVPADLDLLIGAAQILQLPVRAPPH